MRAAFLLFTLVLTCLVSCVAARHQGAASRTLPVVAEQPRDRPFTFTVRCENGNVVEVRMHAPTAGFYSVLIDWRYCVRSEA